MNRFVIFIVLLIAGGGGLFAWRHQTLRQLESQRDRLREQTAEAAALRAEIERARATQTAVASDGLSAAEHSELLRLRGDVGRLRRDLIQETNQLARIKQSLQSQPARTRQRSTARSPVESPSPAEIQQRVSNGRQLAVNLLIYAQDHGSHLPGAWNEASSAGLPLEGAEEYELVQSGVDLTSIQNPALVPLLRERAAWRRNNATRWSRIYAFVDGHVEIAQSETPDFSAWEAEMNTRAAQPRAP